MLRKRLVVRWAIVVFAFACVVAGVVCNWRLINYWADGNELGVYAMSHRREIEADLREVYDEYMSYYTVWEEYKDSTDGEEFGKAVDAWHEMADGHYAGSWGGGRYDGVKFDVCMEVFLHEFSVSGRNVNPAIAMFEEIFWGGEIPLTDLPKDIPRLSVEEDFPQYDGSPLQIEDLAKNRYENVQRELENAKIEMDLGADPVKTATSMYGAAGARMASSIVQSSRMGVEAATEAAAEYAVDYNEFVQKHKDVLEECGFFDEYPTAIKDSDLVPRYRDD